MYDTIQHFGVKGMRWGVRKDRGGLLIFEDLFPQSRQSAEGNLRKLWSSEE